MNSGLLRVNSVSGSMRLPRLKTHFGGDTWVIRSLTPAEALSCWDVPEKLGQLAGTDEAKRMLMKDMFTPLKSRQMVLEDLIPLLPKLIQLSSEGLSQGVRPFSMPKRGPTLHLTKPEDEKLIFRDKSDPPVNLLIEGFEGLNLDRSDKEPVAASNVPTVAAKEDKAPIESEGWDRMLCLGPSEHAREGPWARASRAIRPLIARHWRRLQMRKWIRHVNGVHEKGQEVSETDREAARDCLLRLQATTFWERKSGCRPHFWNFP
jgi:hypothetical protein